VISNIKANVLFELGPVEELGQWADYLEHGFDESDVPDLLKLICDRSLYDTNAGANETWVPIHAWRTLGQLKSAKAVPMLIVLFDHLPYYDWALKELSKVLGMIGEPAIDPLTMYMRESRRPEFARAMAFDGLVEIVRHYPDCRERVLNGFSEHLTQPDTETIRLNGYLVGKLLDLGAVELIDDIRRLFDTGCVDSACSGGLEEVELELGLRVREVAQPRDGPGSRGYVSRESMGIDDFNARIDRFLCRYGSDDSIANASELDGYMAALACAPALIRSARWIPALWGGEESVPEWDSNSEAREFEKMVTALNSAVATSLEKQEYEPLFHEYKTAGIRRLSVEEWCFGFLKGLKLWGLIGRVDRSNSKDLITPVLLFGTKRGIERVRAMDRDAKSLEAKRIQPAVHELYKYFRKQRQKLYADFAKNAVEAGRDEPCPCRSGRLYKNCCLRS